MFAPKSPSPVNPNPSNLPSPRAKILASESREAKGLHVLNPRSAPQARSQFETMSRKIKELWVNSHDLAKTHPIEIKRVNMRIGSLCAEKNILKTKVGYWKLLKTNVDKLSVFRPETMLLKTNGL
ncbi:MAG: hypothetical protein ABSF45_21020 [Terriglobia bacterium]|jgi:hypothetical protein